MDASEAQNILQHFLLDHADGSSCYLLLCGRAQVTVRSQQVRAMNLAWALRDRLNGSSVAVIGGGAAGLTFAAAAAKLGAAVHLFEGAGLMHLQMGELASPVASGDLHVAEGYRLSARVAFAVPRVDHGERA